MQPPQTFDLELVVGVEAALGGCGRPLRVRLLLAAWLRFTEGRYAAGGAGGSDATLWDTQLDCYNLLHLLR